MIQDAEAGRASLWAAYRWLISAQRQSRNHDSGGTTRRGQLRSFALIVSLFALVSLAIRLCARGFPLTLCDQLIPLTLDRR